MTATTPDLATGGPAAGARQPGRPAVFVYRSLIWNFAQRDLKARFKGTAVGWGWSLIVPLASLGIYYLVSRVIFRAVPPDLGNGHKGVFFVYLFAGLTIWSFFANGINTSIGSLLSTGGLLKKIYFPSFTPVLGAMVAVAIQSLIELAIVLVILLALLNVGWTWLLIVPWAVLFLGFTTGLSMVCAIANIYFRDLGHIISVALQLLFYATPIIFTLSVIKNHVLHTVIAASPITEFVELFRDVAYSLTPGSLLQWAYSVGWTAAMLGVGMLVFKKYGRDLGEEV